MIKFLIFLSIIIIGSGFFIYKEYKDSKNLQWTIKAIFFLIILGGSTIFSRYLVIYAPLLLLHILALLIGWGFFFGYLFKKTNLIWPIFLPLLTILIFFITGFFVAKFD